VQSGIRRVIADGPIGQGSVDRKTCGTQSRAREGNVCHLMILGAGEFAGAVCNACIHSPGRSLA